MRQDRLVRLNSAYDTYVGTYYVIGYFGELRIAQLHSCRNVVVISFIPKSVK